MILSSCAAPSLEQRLVTPTEFLAVVDQREATSDSCRPVYCTYILVNDLDTFRYLKRESGRRIVEHVVVPKNGLDSTQRRKLDKIGNFGKCITVQKDSPNNESSVPLLQDQLPNFR